jgi:hypothetical protein
MCDIGKSELRVPQSIQQSRSPIVAHRLFQICARYFEPMGVINRDVGNNSDLFFVERATDVIANSRDYRSALKLELDCNVGERVPETDCRRHDVVGLA